MFTWNCKGRLVEWEGPLVMGILNVTPDSFYSGSRKTGEKEWIETTDRFRKQGAFIVDIGGQSTRPGADKLDVQEELERVIPAIRAVHQAFPDLLISIDTFYGEVARQAVNAGASIVNDVSAGAFDPDMIPAVASLHVPYVLMHTPGTPKDMQSKTQYSQIEQDLLDFFTHKIKDLKEQGIHDLILDPGFGFGKTPEQNFSLIRYLPVFRSLGYPLLLGVSRKSTIYRTLGVTAEEALNGTTVLHTAGLLNGADILRVHDVREAVEAVTLVGHLKE
ncbi:MAG: dihydropteroate synthase, partial [Chitinophagaceae bacterium]|nr:dihydropteroate synthase [Chitinophagaceae bacterium]